MKLAVLGLILLVGCGQHVAEAGMPTVEISAKELDDANREVADIRATLPEYVQDEAMAAWEGHEILIVQQDLESVSGFKGQAYIDAVRQLEYDWSSLVSLDKDLESLYVL